MADYVKWLPGPSQAEEYTGIEALGSAIKNQALAQFVKTAFGIGEVGTPPWTLGFSTFTTSGGPGLPYIQCSWGDVPKSNSVSFRFRFSSALIGMLDPASWFPGIYDGMAVNPQADWQRVHDANSAVIAGLCSSLASVAYSSGLARSAPVAHLNLYRTYTWGPRIGKVYGVHTCASYPPNIAEQGMLPPIRNTEWNKTVWASDADDGTIALASEVVDMTAAISGYPQPVVTSGDGQASWDGLGDEVKNVKDSIDNALPTFVADLPELRDYMIKAPKAWAVNDPESVTHPDAQAGDPYTPVSVSPPARVFATGSALPVVLATPTLIATLSKPVAIKIAGAAATGIAMGTATAAGMWGKLADGAAATKDAALALTGGALDLIADGGLALRELVNGSIESYFDKMVEVADWITSSDGTPVRIRDAQESQASSLEDAVDYLRRIAESLEEIQKEIVRDPASLDEYPGIIGAIEVAERTHTEMEICYHGLRVNAQTGATGMEDD